MDARARKLAKIIVEHSLEVEANDKVVLSASDFTGHELTRSVYRLLLKKKANVYLDIFGTNYEIGRADFAGFYKDYLELASETQLTTKPEIMKQIVDWGEKFVRITAIHDPNFLADADPKKSALWQKTFYPQFKNLIHKEWLLTYFPTEGTAKAAGMSLDEFIDYYYQASIIDYAKLDATIRPLQDLLDKAEVIKIKGQGIDLQLGIKGRKAEGVGSGKKNIPDGECFIAPVEDQTQGFVKFELPQNDKGVEVENIYFEFDQGKIIKYDASKNKHYLDAIFAADPDNMRLGELGIGMNTNITKYITQIIYDEKIKGTVHMAIGRSIYDDPTRPGGGNNAGTIHWDLIKDLRHDGSLVYIDDTLILKNGKYLLS